MILEIDDEEYSDLRAAVLFHLMGALRDLAGAQEKPLSRRMRERCDRIEQLVAKLSSAGLSPNGAAH